MGSNTSKSSGLTTLQVDRERGPFRSLSVSNYRTPPPPKKADLQYNPHTVALTSASISTGGFMKLVESPDNTAAARGLASVITTGAAGRSDRPAAPLIKPLIKQQQQQISKADVKDQEIEIIDAWELMKGLEVEDRSNPSSTSPLLLLPDSHANCLQEAHGNDDMDLFDPDILADFADSLEHDSDASDGWCHVGSDGEKDLDPLSRYELKCPPGGQDRVVLYTTSLRGIRKTFESCNTLRMILESFNVYVDERDVSMHAGFREELKALFGKPVPVPRVFIKGHYIGGAEEVFELHEDGLLIDLVKTLPVRISRQVCDCCGGIRFVPCTECNGSCKILTDTYDVKRCPNCNENGLIRCTLCS
ncbi:unnamed protein product [Sphagnum jensenii]|uniref:Glutaredoxin domain-containing protein n=1 Tax=Sphagnum jensenii TaxID=128206 RepID=A0ABP0WHP8_9BRYO